MAQLTYQNTYSPAFEGMLADVSPRSTTSRANADTVSIPVGVFVKHGTGDNDCLLLTSSSDFVEGITFYSAAGLYDPTAQPANKYAVKSAMNVARSGRVWMKAEQACTPASPVFVRYANGTSALTTRGTVRIDADGAGAFQLRGAKYMTSAAAGALVEVEFHKVANDAAAIP